MSSVERRRRPFRVRAAVMGLLCALLVVGGCASHTVTVYVTRTPTPTATPIPYPHPQVDPEYIYQQLFQLVTQHQSRESGYAVNPFGVASGHDGFANDWAAEMLRDLQGFGAVETRGSFTTTGWRGRPPTRLSVNVEVSVPGLTYPEQMVIVGCHYDGEASSTQSAYDDASGCAIELGVARALAAYWRAHGLYPARTLRFVAFDAEEMAMIGSYQYVNSLIDGDWGNIVAMLNEEQNGIAYPLRFLGKASNPLLPFMAYTSPQYPNSVYASLPLSDAQRAGFQHFQNLVGQGVPEVFSWFQQQGVTSLDYRDNGNHPVTQPVFAATDTGMVHVEDDTYGASDQIPFTELGIPCVTFVGDHSYYTGPFTPWSYPYDQPQDTIEMLNVYASGHTAEARALALALALPALFSAWLLVQPAVLGATPADGLPVAALGDIGPLQTGVPLALSAVGAYDPANPGAALGYVWDFGDGATATGMNVGHAYAHAGDYTLDLDVTSGGRTRHVTARLHVGDAPLTHPNPYSLTHHGGMPAPNPNVTLPTPEP
jgi:Peptidase family M28/PKD domain